MTINGRGPLAASEAELDAVQEPRTADDTDIFLRGVQDKASELDASRLEKFIAVRDAHLQKESKYDFDAIARARKGEEQMKCGECFFIYSREYHTPRRRWVCTHFSFEKDYENGREICKGGDMADVESPDWCPGRKET